MNGYSYIDLAVDADKKNINKTLWGQRRFILPVTYSHTNTIYFTNILVLDEYRV